MALRVFENLIREQFFYLIEIYASNTPSMCVKNDLIGKCNYA